MAGVEATVSGNSVADPGSVGILAVSGANAEVTGDNRVSGGEYGIGFSGQGTSGTIDGNVVRDTSYIGINVELGATATVSGNTVANPGTLGIRALSGTAKVTGDNRVSGGEYGIGFFGAGTTG